MEIAVSKSLTGVISLFYLIVERTELILLERGPSSSSQLFVYVRGSIRLRIEAHKTQFMPTFHRGDCIPSLIRGSLQCVRGE